MSLAVLIPYRPDTPRREQVFATTQRLWARLPVEVCVADDGLTGLFSYARAANRARAKTDAKTLVVYNADALPLPLASLQRLEALLLSGTPWSVIFPGQHRFTVAQTARLIAGAEPDEVGPPDGDIAMGREALLAVRADVWDDLRGMDERFVGWGPEDRAWHQVLRTVHPDGCDIPAEPPFQSLWHPETPRTAHHAGMALWRSYPSNVDPAAMRAWYLSRPEVSGA